MTCDVADTPRLAFRCPRCAASLPDDLRCPACGESFEIRDGIPEIMGPLTGTNRIAAAFYDGPGWARFRPWERLFLRFQGGTRGARMPILRHLPRVTFARVLEVGIGDGENVALLPSGWEIHGVDIARTQLVACRERFPRLAGKLVRAEAEALPFDHSTFDAVFSVGGFNFFRDHAAALREMRRVARPGAPVVVADERPDLRRFALGYQLGVDAFDAWWLRMLGLDAEFAAMAVGLTLDLEELARRELPGCRRWPIWNRLGYCLVDPGDGPRPGRARGRSD